MKCNNCIIYLFVNVDYSLVKDIYKHVSNCILCKFIYIFNVVITIIIQTTTFCWRYWSRTNYHNFFLVCARLFLYRSVHPFKCPVILNITIGLIFDGNDDNFSATLITWTLCKIVTCWFLTLNRKGIVPIMVILLVMENEENVIIACDI
jgi:hypothetical protein